MASRCEDYNNLRFSHGGCPMSLFCSSNNRFIWISNSFSGMMVIREYGTCTTELYSQFSSCLYDAGLPLTTCLSGGCPIAKIFLRTNNRLFSIQQLPSLDTFCELVIGKPLKCGSRRITGYRRSVKSISHSFSLSPFSSFLESLFFLVFHSFSLCFGHLECKPLIPLELNSWPISA